MRAALLAWCLLAAPVHGDGWVLSTPTPPPPPAPEPAPTPAEPVEEEGGPLTYQEAREEALEQGKPLVVWIGQAICPGCVAHTEGEFVHFMAAEHPDFPPNSLTVGWPSNGRLLMAGQVTADQPDGGWFDGHLPTIRRMLELWHSQPVQSRRTVRSVSVPGSVWREGGEAAQPGPAMQPAPLPVMTSLPVMRPVPPPPPVMMLRSQPVMRVAPRMMFGGRACAT